MGDEQAFAEWWRSFMGASADHDAAIHSAYQTMANANLISKVVVHRYVCRKGCGVLATVIRVDGLTIARTSDYKLSPGMNVGRSVAAARQTNTLDGDHHWPGHTFDVGRLNSPGMQIGMNCRHTLANVTTEDIMAKALGVTPGHPGAPTRL